MLEKWPFGVVLLLVLLVACSGNATPDGPTRLSTDAEEAPATLPKSAPATIAPTLAPEILSSRTAGITPASTGTTLPAESTPMSHDETMDEPTETSDEGISQAAGESEDAPRSELSSTEPEALTISGADGLELAATFYPAATVSPGPAVILLHMLGSSQLAWPESGVPAALTEAGYAVLTLDMRGHGETGGEQDWPATELDLQAAWRYLAEKEAIDAERIAVIGASIGANMALRAGANEPAIPTVVLLSPGLDYRSVTTEGALATYGERPLLIVASEEDNYAANSSRTLMEQASASSRLELYEGAGHGTNMFRAKPELIDLILNWLTEQL